ncbi:MAG TPA: hypothetical protein PLT82_05235 [Candidatus Hydrogenedens sp.]|nr:hypothetical protein [Candidatus Hydrogenedens sp.]HOK08828.1 hypothetical protein [Candidatus Hydrogenedens sp.]HOL18686.1 hypothetical protein [Candidatus Hydrogenedens sp.]HPP58517.1 hypothetical protein [Candidatus Hydrogenedens sp.]
MDAYLFICLGTRDVQIRDEVGLDEKVQMELKEYQYPLGKDNRNFRELNVRKFGHWLNNNFDSIKEIIEIPLIEPFLSYIEKKDKLIHRIYLIATDQSKTVSKTDNEHVCRDTCTIAKFLEEKFFPYYYKKESKPCPEIKTVILKNSPNNYDLMIKEFGDFLSKEFEMFSENNNYEVYTEITGGTPQINTSVMLNCIKYYRNKVRFIYKSENSRDIQSLNAAEYILGTYEHENLKQLVERYDFDAVVQNKSYSETIRNLSLSACYRENFDFFNYKKEIDKMYDNVPIGMLEILRKDAFKLCEKEPNSIFNELYWNTVVMWKRDECANFIGRVWRMMETSLQYSLLEIIGCTWDEMIKNSNEKPFESKFRKWAGNNNDFFEFLDENKSDYNISYVKKPIVPNMPTLFASIDFLAETGNNQSKYKNIQKWVRKLRPFASMRNNSIIAHGFENISRESIRSTLEKGEDILLIIRSLIESVGIRLSEENPFNIFKDILIEISEQDLKEILNV